MVQDTKINHHFLGGIIMEKLLNAMASCLFVRVTKKEGAYVPEGAVVSFDNEFDHNETDDETKAIFKRAFKRHLVSKMKEMKDGGIVEYTYDYETRGPLGTIMEDANKNMAEVLLELPSLKEGKCYEFPYDTYIRFKLVKRDKKKNRVEIEVCDWISEELKR